MLLLTELIKEMGGQMFTAEQLCLTTYILMGTWSNLDTVTISAVFPYWDSVAKAFTLTRLMIITRLGQNNFLS